MKRFHLAIGVKNIADSVNDYEKRLGEKALVYIEDTYALFRTQSLNISLRKVDDSTLGLRHLGWEDDSATGFSEDADINGTVWEHFRQEDQIQEILNAWPDAAKDNPYLKT